MFNKADVVSKHCKKNKAFILIGNQNKRWEVGSGGSGGRGSGKKHTEILSTPKIVC